jgi:transcriptional regulator with XRE-family HTH domain
MIMSQEPHIAPLARELGCVLIRLRSRRGWSQEKLSQKAQDGGYSLSRSTIQRMERGDCRSMSLENICFYCLSLGVDPKIVLPIDFHATSHRLDNV